MIELARMAGINVTKLKIGFKEIFDTTVFGCLRARRMERARELLEDGSLPVSEIAFLIGYNSLSHFALAFRRAFGVNPLRYKKGGSCRLFLLRSLRCGLRFWKIRKKR
ncbi:MAG: hypothetical protein Kow009_08130 [Spirochaetales bacterium]